MTLNDIFTNEPREVKFDETYKFPNSMIEEYDFIMEMELCENDN